MLKAPNVLWASFRRLSRTDNSYILIFSENRKRRKASFSMSFCWCIHLQISPRNKVAGSRVGALVVLIIVDIKTISIYTSTHTHSIWMECLFPHIFTNNFSKFLIFTNLSDENVLNCSFNCTSHASNTVYNKVYLFIFQSHM